jgi:hypothetical protein
VAKGTVLLAPLASGSTGMVVFLTWRRTLKFIQLRNGAQLLGIHWKGVIHMEKHLKQTFNINTLKIGSMTNAGVVKIGVGMVKRTAPSIYGEVGTLTGIDSKLVTPAVPFQSPVRKQSMDLP